jgi:SAM-dependent methyltransferase
MAHPEQLQFVKSILESTTNQMLYKKVIEIGSHDVNGSVRKLFSKVEYLGVDLSEGPGVDLVCEGGKVDHESCTYDLALSCECFEHNPLWIDTFSNMYRLAKNGGALLITVATTGREEHGTTRTSPKDSPGTQSIEWDYYKNLIEQDFHNAFDLSSLFEDYFFITNNLSHDLYFFAIKKKASPGLNLNLSNIKKSCLQDQDDLKNLRIKIQKYKKFIPKLLRKIVIQQYIKFGVKDQYPRLINF